MALKFFAATDVDPGEWFTFREAEGEKLEARVRRLPNAERERIERKHFGKVRRLTYTDDGPVQELNRDKQSAAMRERASYCLIDTRGFELQPGGEDGARRLGDLLGRKVSVGDVVSLDGQWTDALKDLIFAGMEDLEAWVNERSADIAKRDREQEKEAEGN